MTGIEKRIAQAKAENEIHQMTLAISACLNRRLDAAAKILDCSKTALIREALSEALDQLERKRKADKK